MLLDVDAAALGVLGHGGLVDLDVVLPGADHRAVGAGDGGHAVVAAAGELELVLVGESRPVQLVLEVHGDVVAGVHGVVAGPLAARLAAAAAGGAHVRAGAAQVEAELGELGEDGLERLGAAAQQYHVAGGAVEVGDSRAVLVPDVADLAQDVRGVEPSRGLVDAEGVEMGHVGELLGQVVVAADDPAAVTHHAHDAAVLPVADFLLVGQFELLQEVHCFGPPLCSHLDVLHEARPRPALQLVQQRGFMLCHLLPP